MLKPKLRILRVTAAALLLGGAACGGPKHAATDGSTSGVDTSSDRIRALSQAVCDQAQECNPEGFSEDYSDLDDCTEDHVVEFPLSGQTGEGVRECQDAMLDLAVCYTQIACETLRQESQKRCGGLQDTYEDLCRGLDSEGAHGLRSFRILR